MAQPFSTSRTAFGLTVQAEAQIFKIIRGSGLVDYGTQVKFQIKLDGHIRYYLSRIEKPLSGLELDKVLDQFLKRRVIQLNEELG